MLLIALSSSHVARAEEFAATGPGRETKLPPEKFLGAVKVTFDLQPTTMSFDLPWHFCSVAENGLKFAHFAAETYDPRRWEGKGADASFEPGMDKEGRFARVWPRRGFARLGDAGARGPFPVTRHTDNLLLLCNPDAQSSVLATLPPGVATGTTMQCTKCEAPNRMLWVLFGEHKRPALVDVQTGTWIVLCRCPGCGSLWCLSQYEPYASFPFLALWPHDEARWQRSSALDDGRVLRGWHAFMVGQHYHSLPEPERELVEQFRRRSYGHNPIDSPDTFLAADFTA